MLFLFINILEKIVANMITKHLNTNNIGLISDSMDLEAVILLYLHVVLSTMNYARLMNVNNLVSLQSWTYQKNLLRK